MTARIFAFAAIVLTAIALVPSGAHLFELPGKIALDRDAYFTVQRIYAGWSLFGIVLIGAVPVLLVLIFLLRADRPAVFFASVALLALLLDLAIFFAWTFPANQATANWTAAPENWEALRRAWEYSHAVNAGVILVAFLASVLAGLTMHPAAMR